MQDIIAETVREFIQSPEGDQMIGRIAEKIFEDNCAKREKGIIIRDNPLDFLHT
jgi:hypothetical protein